MLRVTGRKKGLFVVAPKNCYKTFWVERDDKLIEEIIFKASEFYRNCLLPEIVDSRKRRRMDLRNMKQEASTSTMSQKRKSSVVRKKTEITVKQIKLVDHHPPMRPFTQTPCHQPIKPSIHASSHPPIKLSIHASSHPTIHPHIHL